MRFNRKKTNLIYNTNQNYICRTDLIKSKYKSDLSLYTRECINNERIFCDGDYYEICSECQYRNDEICQEMTSSRIFIGATRNGKFEARENLFTNLE